MALPRRRGGPGVSLKKMGGSGVADFSTGLCYRCSGEFLLTWKEMIDSIRNIGLHQFGPRTEWHWRKLKLLWHNGFGSGCEGTA